VHAGGDHAVRRQRLRAAAQDRGIARLQAQARGIRGHVRARLVDDPDHAERHAHAPDLDAAGAVGEIRDRTDGVGQRGDLLEPLDHGVDADVIELQAVQRRGVQPLRRRARHVVAIGRDELGTCGRDRGARFLQRAVLGLRRRARHQPRGGPRFAADVGHIRPDIHAMSGPEWK